MLLLGVEENVCCGRDFSNCAMGRVKSFDSITKLQSRLVDEGFVNVTLSYLGGLWVMFECDKPDTKRNLVNHVGINSWFQVIQEVNPDFVSDEPFSVVRLLREFPLYAWFLAKRLIKSVKPNGGSVTMKTVKCISVAKRAVTWTPSYESIRNMIFLG
ncbi:hypothetical protein Tco_0332331 [Tanacetum coccineum]